MVSKLVCTFALSPFAQARDTVQEEEKEKRADSTWKKVRAVSGKNLGCESVKRALLVVSKWIL
jgi:hypothetical protein